jgi:hypothetical protein
MTQQKGKTMKIGKVEIGIVVATIVLVCVLFLVGSAQSQTPQDCRPYEQAHKFLKEKMNESPVFTGLSASGHLTALYFSYKTGNWTAVVIPPVDPKMMCIVDHGTDSYVRISARESEIEFND